MGRKGVLLVLEVLFSDCREISENGKVLLVYSRGTVRGSDETSCTVGLGRLRPIMEILLGTCRTGEVW